MISGSMSLLVVHSPRLSTKLLSMKHWPLGFLLCLSFAAYTQTIKKLVIVGDSLTEGYGVSREKAYPALLQKKIGKAWLVVNSGISGSTSASAVARVRWHLKQKPDLLILALGANDGLRGLPVKNMEKNLDEALALCQKNSLKVILVGMQIPPNYGASYSHDFAAVFPHLAHKYSLPLIPFLLVNVAGHATLNQADRIHPNELGHAIVAETVYQAIKKYL